MLYIVQGRSGTGKTTYVSNVLAQLAKNGEDKLLYLIPEQSSFESETAFLRMLGAKLSRNVNVMSFTRLYDMVMRKTGGISGTPIDDGVRKVLMSLALEDCRDKLEIYSRQALKPQFTDLMLSAVKEFKMCGISTDDLREKSKQTKGTDLSQKLSEVSLVTDVYNAHILESYIDPLDNNARLEKRLAEVGFFEGYTVVVDGFSGFTAQERRILNLIMEQSKDFYVTLCTDCTCEEELFFTVNRTKKQLIQNARRLSVPIASPINLTENFRTNTNGLKFVESGIYKFGYKPYGGILEENTQTEIMPDTSESADSTQYKSLSDGVTIGIASDIFEECDYIAGCIKELALSGECRYKDIAVVCRNSESYRGILDSVFDSHKIPYFMSKPQPVDTKPIMLLVLSALEYVITPSDSEKLFSIAKCGLVNISEYEASLLENYAYIWNLNGKRFAEEFTSNPDGYTNRVSEQTEEDLAQLNVAREKLIIPLLNFASKLENASALKISTAIYELLLEYNVPERLKNDTELSGYEEFSNEEVRLWDMLMDMLNKVYLAVGERSITVKRYYELLRMVIRTADISEIPQTLDQVLIGNADIIRLSSPYAVFVIGAINGEFPHNPVSSGVFNDAERRSLITLDLPVYDAIAELFMHEKFLVYNAVSAPTNKLYVTYYTKDLKGSALQPSSIITEIVRIMPDVKTDIVSSMKGIDRIHSEKSAFERLALFYGQKSALGSALKAYFSQKPEYSDRLLAMDNVVKKGELKLEDKKLAVALFGRDKNLSATQIEKFYMCRFQYFCTYGLKLKERRRMQIGALEFGNIVHYLLENVMTYYKENDYIKLADDELEELLDELLKKYISEVLGGESDKNERFKYLYYRLKDNALALVNHLSEELEQSEFKPVDLELPVGMGKDGIKAYTVLDSNGNIVRVCGSVDRVDIMKTDKASYVRIVDYKTGKKDFKISDVLYGLNMQMLIYLSAVAKNGADRYGEDLRPSGILYMPSTVSAVNVSPDASEDSIKKEHDKNLKMNGLFLDEIHVLKSMDESLSGKYIPIYISKQGKYMYHSENYVISNRQLNMLFNKVESKIVQMSEELDSGNISAVPATGAYNACEWCIYSAVCGHGSNDKEKCVTRFKKDEVTKILEDEFGEGDKE